MQGNSQPAPVPRSPGGGCNADPNSCNVRRGRLLWPPPARPKPQPPCTVRPPASMNPEPGGGGRRSPSDESGRGGGRGRPHAAPRGTSTPGPPGCFQVARMVAGCMCGRSAQPGANRRETAQRGPRTLPQDDGWPRGRTIGQQLHGRGVNPANGDYWHGDEVADASGQRSRLPMVLARRPGIVATSGNLAAVLRRPRPIPCRRITGKASRPRRPSKWQPRRPGWPRPCQSKRPAPGSLAAPESSKPRPSSRSRTVEAARALGRPRRARRSRPPWCRPGSRLNASRPPGVLQWPLHLAAAPEAASRRAWPTVRNHVKHGPRSLRHCDGWPRGRAAVRLSPWRAVRRPLRRLGPP